MGFDFDATHWKGLADEAGMNAVFHPQTRIQVSWLDPADQHPAEHPALEVAGAMAFLYVDPEQRALRLSLDLDTTIEHLQRPDSTIPLRIMVGDTTLFDDTDAGAIHVEQQTPQFECDDNADSRMHYLLQWAKAVISGALPDFTSTKIAAGTVLGLDEYLAEGGMLPVGWVRAEKPSIERTSPMVTIENDRLICPECGAADRISEEDQAIRWNTLTVSGDRIRDEQGEADFEHERFLCQNCGSNVDLPLDSYDLDYG